MEKYEAQAKRFLIFFAVALLTVGAFFLFLKYLFVPVLPLLAAWLISWPTLTLADKLSKRTRISKKVWCLFFLILFSLLLLALVAAGCSALLYEAKKLVSGEYGLIEKLDGLFKEAAAFLSRHFPKLVGYIDEKGMEAKIFDLITEQTGRISGLIARAAAAVPGAAFFAVVTFIAAYYLACDNRRIKTKIASYFSPERADRIAEVFRAVKSSILSYLRAGGYLMILTFFETLVGLIILGIGFPVLLSMLVAALDFLPVLGTGVILAPMGAVLLIGGEYYKGVGLLILWGVTTLVRQIVEPKIVSKSVGIHPLFSLSSAYVGFRLFGAVGLIVLPILMTVSAAMYRSLAASRRKYRDR